MRLAVPRSFVPVLLALPLFALPTVAAAGGAFLIKAGTVKLSDDSQTFDGALRSFDEDSYGTLTLGIEARKQSGVAFGAEFLTYHNDFTPPNAEPGEGTTRAVMFVGKKYFIQDGPFHPFFGAGVGGARISYEFTDPVLGHVSDDEFALVLQAVIGLELRFEGLAFSLEAKHIYHDIGSGANEYDPTGTGLFAGFGFTW